ncbi:hypothetical protein IWZ00DRAFT_297081 [Phyllosticta capitalensis]
MDGTGRGSRADRTLTPKQAMKGNMEPVRPLFREVSLCHSDDLIFGLGPSCCFVHDRRAERRLLLYCAAHLAVIVVALSGSPIAPPPLLVAITATNLAPCHSLRACQSGQSAYRQPATSPRPQSFHSSRYPIPVPTGPPSNIVALTAASSKK